MSGLILFDLRLEDERKSCYYFYMNIVIKYLAIVGGIVLLVSILIFSLGQKQEEEFLAENQKISEEIFPKQATSLQPSTEPDIPPEPPAINPALDRGVLKGGVKAVIPVVPKEQGLIPPKLVPKVEIPKEILPEPKSAEERSEIVGKILPPLDEKAIMSAVVKIQCPTEDGLGKYVGSGFAVDGGKVVTAAHVVKDSGSATCDIIFQKDRRPVHYLHGTLESLQTIIKRHDEDGIDVATLTLPRLDDYPEAQAIFSKYPKIPYPVCTNSQMVGDKLLHFGYPSNYADQNYLSRLEGEAVVHADIKGIKEQLSEDQTFVFKTPIFGFTYDESGMHPYMVSRVASFYGDSGGLAFNATKQCILGPHRGGTIGKSAGENFSVFINLGWSGAGSLLLAN